MFKDGIKLSENVYKLTASKIYLINELILNYFLTIDYKLWNSIVDKGVLNWCF